MGRWQLPLNWPLTLGRPVTSGKLAWLRSLIGAHSLATCSRRQLWRPHVLNTTMRPLSAHMMPGMAGLLAQVVLAVT
jgi:hypothetical protein